MAEPDTDRSRVVEVITGLARRSVQIVKRRAEVRFYLETEVPLLASSASARYTLHCTTWGADISYKGLGLIAAEPIMSGKLLYADLSVPAKRLLIVPIRLVYCRQLVPSVFRLGAEFTDDQGRSCDARAYPRLAQTDTPPDEDVSQLLSVQAKAPT